MNRAMDKQNPVGRKLQGKKAIGGAGGGCPLTPKLHAYVLCMASLTLLWPRPLMAVTAPAAVEEIFPEQVEKSADETSGKEDKLNLKMALHLNQMRVGGELGY